jgi:NAD(P)-dependent dehydrogenase (short-subunit alcohol dehydrogenase family)
VDVRGKVAHVTGAGSGIGRAIASRLAEEGASVVVSDVDDRGGSETVERIGQSGGRAAFVRADVAEEGDVRAMIGFTEETFGGLDVLVNNAGGSEGPYFPNADPAHWLRAMAVNLLGVMLGTHYGVAAMRRRGGGAIVNISSRAGIGFQPYASPEYATSKAAIWRFTASLGSLGESDGIRVNCIAPDWVGIEKIRAAQQAMGEAWTQVGPAELVPSETIAGVAAELVRRDDLAGRVVLCPHDGDWGVVPLDDTPRVEPLGGVPERWPPA